MYIEPQVDSERARFTQKEQLANDLISFSSEINGVDLIKNQKIKTAIMKDELCSNISRLNKSQSQVFLS